MSFLKNIASGYLGNKANQAIGRIKNPIARRLAGNVLGASPLGQFIPGLANPPRNPDQNLLFGARMLSELQIRGNTTANRTICRYKKQMQYQRIQKKKKKDRLS